MALDLMAPPVPKQKTSAATEQKRPAGAGSRLDDPGKLL